MVKMTKTRVRLIEAKARRIMRIDNIIWAKYHWQSEGEVNWIIYKKEVNKRIKGKLPMIVYYVLQDANFHTMNKMLTELNKFKGTYGNPKTEAEWEEYGRLGGKTWEL